jgi:hypothetical protein
MSNSLVPHPRGSMVHSIAVLRPVCIDQQANVAAA